MARKRDTLAVDNLLGLFRRKPRKVYPKPNAPCGGRLRSTETGLCFDCEDCGERYTHYWVGKHQGLCTMPVWNLERRVSLPFAVVIKDWKDLS